MRDLDELLHDRLAAESTRPATPFATVRADAGRRRARRRAAVAVCAVAVVAGVVAASTRAANDPAKPAGVVATDDGSPETSTAPSAEPTIVGAVDYDPRTSAINCVVQYDTRQLANRLFAFDGTVVAVGPSVTDRGDDGDLAASGVTFRVTRWYTGGKGDEFTLDVQAARDSYEIGTRMLVSGEDRWDSGQLDAPIAWSCGFTRYWDQQTAADWERAFTR